MTRASRTGGVYEIDEVMALPPYAGVLANGVSYGRAERCRCHGVGTVSDDGEGRRVTARGSIAVSEQLNTCPKWNFRAAPWVVGL